jgi:hypothetical protein
MHPTKPALEQVFQKYLRSIEVLSECRLTDSAAWFSSN